MITKKERKGISLAQKKTLKKRGMNAAWEASLQMLFLGLNYPTHLSLLGSKDCPIHMLIPICLPRFRLSSPLIGGMLTVLPLLVLLFDVLFTSILKHLPYIPL